MRELLGDGGELGAVDGAAPGVVGAAVEPAGVDHPTHGVVGDAEQGSGLGDAQMRHESDSIAADAAIVPRCRVRASTAGRPDRVLRSERQGA